MCFNYSGYVTYVGTNFLTQRVTCPASHLPRWGQTLRNGMAAYGYGRWGDYTAGHGRWRLRLVQRHVRPLRRLWNTGIAKPGTLLPLNRNHNIAV